MQVLRFSNISRIELRAKYKRTSIGSLWNLVGFVLKVAVLTAIYTGVLNKDIEEYLPFLMIGIGLWGLISGALMYGCTAIVNNIKMIYMSSDFLFGAVYKGVFREVYLFAPLGVVIILTLTFLGRLSFSGAVGGAVGVAMLVVLLYQMALSLSFSCARKPYLRHVFSSVMAIAFIASPVIWDRGDLGDMQLVADLNPFYYMLGLVREPILHGVFFWKGVVFFFGLMLFLVPLNLFLYKLTVNRLAYYE